MKAWTCDTCGKLGVSPTALDHVTVLPKGWRKRYGTVSKGKDRYGVQLHACSAKCAERYDAVEFKNEGILWQRPDADEHPVILPHKVR